MSRRKKRPELATAITQLRAAFGETQQEFSRRLNVSLPTIGRWEIADRRPSTAHLKEMWHLSAEKEKPELVQIFGDAFAIAAGYELSSGALGFQIRQLIRDINSSASRLIREHDKLTSDGQKDLLKILSAVQELSGAVRQLDIEPPFRSIVIQGGKRI